MARSRSTSLIGAVNISPGVPIKDSDPIAERRAALAAQDKKLRSDPRTLTLDQLLDYEHRFGGNPGWTVGSDLRARVVIDDSPPGVVTSTGADERIFD